MWLAIGFLISTPSSFVLLTEVMGFNGEHLPLSGTIAGAVVVVLSSGEREWLVQSIVLSIDINAWSLTSSLPAIVVSYILCIRDEDDVSQLS